MFINNLPQNNQTPNFGFNVKVKENSRLVSMADSYLFRSLPKDSIELFEKKAAEILPDRNVNIEYSVWRSEPYELFAVDLYTDGKCVDKSLGHDARGLLNYLKKATNRYYTLHSKLFYDGKKSPETLAKIERFKETVYRPFNRTKGK